MIAIAIVALLTCAGIGLERRRARFHKLAAYYRGKVNHGPQFPYLSITYKEWESYVRLGPRLGRYHAEMRKKYEFAERFPWLPVMPDLPEPK
jgi:hypothetical protein